MKVPADNASKPGTRDAGVALRARQPVCENAVFSVFLDHIADARGNEVTRYLSVIPKHTAGDWVSGVAVLPIVDGKFGLIRVFRHPLDRWSWEVAKGMVDTGESETRAALRELHEETGFTATPESLTDLGLTAPEAGVIKGRIRLFSAMLNGKASGGVAGELGHGEMAFFKDNEILSLVAKGEIEDACTLSILFKHVIKEKKWP